MPVCFLVSEIAVECDAQGDQMSSDISVCGVFTTDKLANEAVLTWHERDYVPVAAGDFDSYRLSKPEGLLHLVACAGTKSWEVSIEMIVMNTEFTMSLLDPSIPEDQEQEEEQTAAGILPITEIKSERQPTTTTTAPTAVKRRKIKTEPKDTEVRTLNTDNAKRKKTTTASPKQSHHKKKSSVVVLKCPSSAVNGSLKRDSTQNTPTTSPIVKEQIGKSSREKVVHQNGVKDKMMGETRPTPTKSYFDKILMPSDRPSEETWNNMEEKRKKKVEKELRQLQGWTSD